MSVGIKEIGLNQQAYLAMQIKLMQLHREGLNRLTLDQLIDTIKGLRWKRRKPATLSDCVEDIFKTSKEEIVIFLSKKAIIDGYSLKISDFEDLIGGK